MNDTPFSSESVFAEQFPVNENVHYLNHAAVAPWPECAREAVQRFATENVQTGATHYPEWIKEEKSLRDRLAKLIGTARTDSVALVKNTSEALSVVAYGIDWNPGDVIVISNDEFPSNRIVWESLTEKFGVEVRRSVSKLAILRKISYSNQRRRPVDFGERRSVCIRYTP